MRESRLYTNQPLEPGDEITLENERHHYLIRVLRHPRGAPLTLINGDGRELLGNLVYADQKIARIQVTDAVSVDKESPLEIHLYQALTKNEKMDWIIQKATELGAASVHPILTEYSQRPFQEHKVASKLEHWQRIVIGATEQCGRARLMQVTPPTPYASAWAQSTGEKVICTPLREKAPQMNRISTRLSLFIGPEGGFSPSEIEHAVNEGAHLLSLGPRILRTETAAVAALTVAQWQSGDLCLR